MSDSNPKNKNSASICFYDEENEEPKNLIKGDDGKQYIMECSIDIPEEVFDQKNKRYAQLIQDNFMNASICFKTNPNNCIIEVKHSNKRKDLLYVFNKEQYDEFSKYLQRRMYIECEDRINRISQAILTSTAIEVLYDEELFAEQFEAQMNYACRKALAEGTDKFSVKRELSKLFNEFETVFPKFYEILKDFTKKNNVLNRIKKFNQDKFCKMHDKKKSEPDVIKEEIELWAIAEAYKLMKKNQKTGRHEWIVNKECKQ